MCVPHLEFQLINPTTQIALFTLCVENCTNIRSIKWNVYHGEKNLSSYFIKWTLFDQMNLYENISFFGKNIFLIHKLSLLIILGIHTNNFTATSSLNFLINQSPANGSCSITPLNGTTTTLFTISCSNWFDEDNIKDYLVYCMKISSIFHNLKLIFRLHR